MSIPMDRLIPESNVNACFLQKDRINVIPDTLKKRLSYLKFVVQNTFQKTRKVIRKYESYDIHILLH